MLSLVFAFMLQNAHATDFEFSLKFEASRCLSPSETQDPCSLITSKQNNIAVTLGHCDTIGGVETCYGSFNDVIRVDGQGLQANIQITSVRTGNDVKYHFSNEVSLAQSAATNTIETTLPKFTDFSGTAIFADATSTMTYQLKVTVGPKM